MIILFRENQLRYLASIKDIYLHLDATGSIATLPPYAQEKMAICYYALTLPGSTLFSPVEVMKSYQSLHTESAVTYVLNYFLDNLKFTNKIIKKIETDFSLVLLKSACYATHKINLYDYMDVIYIEAEKKKPINKNITILHICSSHVIKTTKKT